MARLCRPVCAGRGYISANVMGISVPTANTSGTSITSTDSTHTNSWKLMIVSSNDNVRYPLLLLLHRLVLR